MKQIISTTLLFLTIFSVTGINAQREIYKPTLTIPCNPLPYFKPYVTDDPQKGNAAGPSTVQITVVNPVTGSWNVYYTGNNSTVGGYTTNYKTALTKTGATLVWQCDILVSDRFESVAKEGSPIAITKAKQPFSEQKTLSAKITLNTCNGDVEISGLPTGTKRYTCTLSPANILYGFGNDGSLLAITFGIPTYTHPVN